MQSRRPSSCAAPSIWNATVAAPSRNPSGKGRSFALMRSLLPAHGGGIRCRGDDAVAPLSTHRPGGTRLRCPRPGTVDWMRTPSPHPELRMTTVVVDVMPKAELLDPQGKAVAGALARRG